jgi:hypothetical protein
VELGAKPYELCSRQPRLVVDIEDLVEGKEVGLNLIAEFYDP